MTPTKHDAKPAGKSKPNGQETWAGAAAHAAVTQSVKHLSARAQNLLRDSDSEAVLWWDHDANPESLWQTAKLRPPKAHPHPGKAADGNRLHVLEPDPVTAAVVQRIFAEYLTGLGFFAIAQRLTAEDIPCPSAYDRKRNNHRCGIAWSKDHPPSVYLREDQLARPLD
ncbi:recombinase family protein [Nocardia sp. NPDC051052]|uniref:recombinase family protein n=1 Tax=Nocardia sp. NPDC051052 TaxID=3364322 RepID=UPI0037893F43